VTAARLEDLLRELAPQVLGALVRHHGHFDTCEDAVQEALLAAAQQWPVDGVPDNPRSWLIRVASNKYTDQVRSEQARRRREEAVAQEPAIEEGGSTDDSPVLLFLCCHPTLSPPSQVALTLRAVGGLTTDEIARAFLVPEATMAARITRAKRKIRIAGIPYRVPDGDELAPRLEQVLSVVYLVYTTGHSAPSGARLMRRDLAERGQELARMLRALLPTDPDVAGLLALVVLTDARQDARVDADGHLVLLEDQDRSRWDRTAISEGVMLVRDALRARAPGRYTLMAAIAAVHDESPSWSSTDWGEVLALYDLLRELWDSPVVELNRAIALAFAVGPAIGLARLDELGADPRLARYPYLAAARADCLIRLGRRAEARVAYDEALILTENEVERDFLIARSRALDENS
jgi:RNA polymerase sigma factor (sigma-70 family)